MLGVDSQIFCQNCNIEYKDNNLPRMLTMCGDTFCEMCIINMFKEVNDQRKSCFEITCPEDGTKMCLAIKDIAMFPKNLALIKVLQIKKNNSSFKDESFNLSKIVKQQEAQQDDLTEELITVMTGGNGVQQNSIQKDINLGNIEVKLDNQIELKKQIKAEEKIQISQNASKTKDLDELCLLHQKPLEIICLNDQQKICAKCAIFGEHKGHDFKSIDELETQKSACYMNLLKVFEQKQEICVKMSNQQTSKGLIDILMNKKGILEGQVRDEFRKLRQQITKQQRKVLKKLDQIYRVTEIKIKSLLKFDQLTEKKFLSWQSQSFDAIKILQGHDFENIVKVLYSKAEISTKLLKKGEEILNSMKNQQNMILQKVEKLLADLKCNKSQEIFNSLNSFIDISITVQNQSNKQNINKVQLAITKQQQLNQKINTSFFDEINKQNSKSFEGSPLLEESLLEIEDCSKQTVIIIQDFSHNQIQKNELKNPLRTNKNLTNKIPHEQSISCSFTHLQLESARKLPLRESFSRINYENTQNEDIFETSRRSFMFTSRPSLSSKIQNGQKPSKKKLKSIKISQKYEKILEGIYNNTLDTIDLTNSQVGDQIMNQICDFVKFSKARTIKFIRNKLTDSGIQKIIPNLGNAQILNLSQNNLTENVLDIFIKHRYGYLSGLKNLILSQNKIIERKHKAKIDQLRSMNLTVSV